ncbi:helix-turn-helix transcriptional regulator [Halotia wernerae UHCC 0503]|nr:helix-turn-helix transcriptional regulator [Halotia wernerae UHCC 0503]
MKKKHPWLVEIGKNIRAIRESKGLSQEELAELIEIDRTYIGGIERGERNVTSSGLLLHLTPKLGTCFQD